MSVPEQASLLPVESRPWEDNATHSPISVFIGSLVRLHLLGVMPIEKFEKWFASHERSPLQIPTLLVAEKFLSARTFVVGGSPASRQGLLHILRRKWRPMSIVCDLDTSVDLPVFEGKSDEGEGRVWICRKQSCGLPVSDPVKLSL